MIAGNGKESAELFHDQAHGGPRAALPVFKRNEPIQKYGELFRKVEINLVNGFLHRRISGVRDLSISSLYEISEMLVYELPGSPELIVEAMRPDDLDHFFPRHLLNVAILSCKLGLEQKLNNEGLVELGVAALIHDLGMLLIDPDVFIHPRALSDKERQIVESHPSVASRFLDEIKNEFPFLAKIVFQEHQRENGSGYPRSDGGELHPYSKIIGLCDTFEALTHKRHHRLPYHPSDAMKIIIKARGREFAPNIIRAFIEIMSLYPVGSMVVLNNDKVGRVISAVARFPLKPNIQIMEKDSLNPPILELSKESNFHIVGIVPDERFRRIDPKSELSDLR